MATYKKKTYKMPVGLEQWEADRLAVRFQYALGSLIESFYGKRRASKAQVQHDYIDRPSKDYWGHGGPHQRRLQEAVTALRKAKLPKSFIQELFDACYEAEYEVISEIQSREEVSA